MSDTPSYMDWIAGESRWLGSNADGEVWTEEDFSCLAPMTRPEAESATSGANEDDKAAALEHNYPYMNGTEHKLAGLCFPDRGERIAGPDERIIGPDGFGSMGEMPKRAREDARAGLLKIQEVSFVRDRGAVPYRFEPDKNGCLICVSHKPNHGGYIRHRGKGVDTRLHRFIYGVLSGSPVPEHLVVRHLCGNPGCCNPLHLAAGTNKENSEDMVAHGRSTRGRKGPVCKLNEDQVMEIYRSTGPREGLAKKYGITVGAISKIRHGKAWAWLTRPEFASSSANHPETPDSCHGGDRQEGGPDA